MSQLSIRNFFFTAKAPKALTKSGKLSHTESSDPAIGGSGGSGGSSSSSSTRAPPSAEKERKARVRKEKGEYVPKQRGGAEAILLTLYERFAHPSFPDQSEWMWKSTIIKNAQSKCDASFTVPAPGPYPATAWTSFNTLENNGLARRSDRHKNPGNMYGGVAMRQALFTITDKGRDLAQRILGETDTLGAAGETGGNGKSSRATLAIWEGKAAAVEEGDGGGGDGEKRKKQKRACRCGSTSHSRTTHTECPLRKTKAAAPFASDMQDEPRGDGMVTPRFCSTVSASGGGAMAVAAEQDNKEEEDEEGVMHRPKKQRRRRIIDDDDDDDDDSAEEQGLSYTPAVSTPLASALVASVDVPAVVDLTLDSDDDE